MPAQIDRDQWSGEGEFTQTLLDWLVRQATVAFLKVEDSTATRADVEYNFISNEIFLEFLITERVEAHRLWGIIPRRRMVTDKLMTIEQLEGALAEDGEIAAPDYADEGMIQFLRAERIVPPYQSRGYKLVELVRIFEVGTPPRR